MVSSVMLRLLAIVALTLLALDWQGGSAQNPQEEEQRLYAKFMDVLRAKSTHDEQSSWKNWFLSLFRKKEEDTLKILVSEYDKLNSLIEQELPGLVDQHEATVDQVLKWFGDNDERVAKMREAAQYFGSLNDVLKEGLRCSHTAEKVLRVNQYCAEASKSPLDTVRPRRIDLVMDHFFESHRRLCWGLYPKKYTDLMESKGADFYQGLLTTEWISQLMTNSKVGNSAEFLSYLSLASDEPALSGDQLKMLAKEIYDEMCRKEKRSMIKDDKLIPKKFNERYNKYVNEPCTNFIADFSDQVYGPAQFDLQTNKRWYEDVPMDSDFIMGWARREICEAIRNPKSEFKKLVKAVAESRVTGE